MNKVEGENIFDNSLKVVKYSTAILPTASLIDLQKYLDE
jgi:hypothetical protein